MSRHSAVEENEPIMLETGHREEEPAVSSVAIEARQISKSYGSIQAVESLSFAVAAGEIFGIVGANGAGKSSVLRMVVNLMRPDQGQVRVLGRPLNREISDRIGYLPEERGIYTRARVGEVVEYFARLKGQDARSAKSNAAFWLGRFGLADRARGRVEELSKGNQQKIQLAAMLAGNPQILVLDEPMSGLDPLTARLVVEVIRELAAAGRTILLSTHDLNQVQSLCGRIMMIHRGRRVLYGEIAAIRRELSGGSAQIRTDADLVRCPFVSAVEPVAAGLRVFLRDGAAWCDVLGWISASGARLSYFEEAGESIEEVFVRTARHES